MYSSNCRLLGFLFCFLQISSLCAQESNLSKSIKSFRNQQFDSAMIYSSLAIQDFTQKNQQDSVVIAYVHQTDIFLGN